MDISSSIDSRLKELATEENIRILYACESGSRAWGFPSSDSDYDVRFIYVHPVEWYLSVFSKRDVLERPIDDSLDLSGWDLRKALQLLSKSNPPLLEWLGSPIIYQEDEGAVAELRSLAARAYAPVSCAFHYLHMAKGNNREYLQGDIVNLKKYLYVLRPILAILWIERELGPVPTDFNVLVGTLVEDVSLRLAIEDLLELKRSKKELDCGPRIPEISDFIEQQLQRLQDFHHLPPKNPVGTEELDAVFRRILWRAEEGRV